MSLCTLNGDQKLSLSEFPNLSIIMVFFRKTAYESKQEHCYPFLFLFFLITFLSCFKKIWPDSFFPHHAMLLFSMSFYIHAHTSHLRGSDNEGSRGDRKVRNVTWGRSWCWAVNPGVLQSMDHKELDTTEKLN